MRYPKFLFPLILAAAVACGGSNDNNAGGAPVQPVGDAPFADVLEASGYHAVLVRDFPSQVPTRKAKIVVYRSSTGGKSGGVLYVNYAEGVRDRVVWHWYFEDGAPDSITTVELNDDGLWDVRLHFGGDTKDLVQDKDFTFVSRGRHDLIATNGASNHPEDLWRTFDGDSITVWKAQADGEETWIDVPAPLGASDGVLMVQLAPTGRPGSVNVKLNGKEVKKFDLEMTLARQMFQLDTAVPPGATVRLEFPPSSDGTVALSEVGVR